MSKTGELLGRLLLWGILFLVGAAAGFFLFVETFPVGLEPDSRSSADQLPVHDESRESRDLATLLVFMLVCGAGAVVLYELHEYENRRRRSFRSRVKKRSKPLKDVWTDIGNGEARE